MQITSVEYRRLISFGSYENETVGAVASVDPGESPDTALTELRHWVEARVRVREEFSEVERRLFEYRNRLQELLRDLAGAQERWQKAQAFLERHGLDIPEELPF